MQTERICERVLSTLMLIDRRIEQAKHTPSISLRCPDYVWIRYRDYMCCVLQCGMSCHDLCGFIMIGKNDAPLQWPTDVTRKPFGGVGIDFACDYGNHRTLVGFHTKHLIDDLSLPGTFPKTVDYIVQQLKKYIDECLASAARPPAKKQKVSRTCK